MGCDIHWVLERKYGDDWVGLHVFGHLPIKAIEVVYYNKEGEVSPQPNHLAWRIRERDYAFFYALVGIRGRDTSETPPREPLGLPKNQSQLSRFELDDDGDLHSHSWISLRDLIPILIKVKEGRDMTSAMVAEALLDEQKLVNEILAKYIDDYIEKEEIDEYRLVFAFDN